MTASVAAAATAPAIGIERLDDGAIVILTINRPRSGNAPDIENRNQVMCTATGDLASSFAAFGEDGTSCWHPTMTHAADRYDPNLAVR